MGDFGEDTKVEALGDGRYRATLSPDWAIWGPNGGYLATIALRACGDAATIPRPASFTCHFLRRGEFDEVTIAVDALQQGRRSESFAFRILQPNPKDGAERVLAAGLLRTAAEGPGLTHDVVQPPPSPPPQTLQTIEEVLGGEVESPFPFWKNFDRKPPDPSWVRGTPQRREPMAREWMRFRPRATFEGDPFLDAGRAVLLIDTFTWPAAVGPHVGTETIAPNIDLNVWFHRQRPDEQWQLIDAESPLAEGGLMGTHSCVWSEGGQLLATGGAQLMCVPPPSG